MKYIFLIVLFCILALACFSQSDSILRDEKPPDTVYVKAVHLESGKTIYPKYIYRKGDYWYAYGRKIKIILYKLRDGISGEWYLWPDN